MIDKAISQIEIGIQAQLKIIASGRNIPANASAFNELVSAKKALQDMLKPAAAPRAAPRKKVVVNSKRGSI